MVTSTAIYDFDVSEHVDWAHCTDVGASLTVLAQHGSSALVNRQTLLGATVY